MYSTKPPPTYRLLMFHSDIFHKSRSSCHSPSSPSAPPAKLSAPLQLLAAEHHVQATSNQQGEGTSWVKRHCNDDSSSQNLSLKMSVGHLGEKLPQRLSALLAITALHSSSHQVNPHHHFDLVYNEGEGDFSLSSFSPTGSSMPGLHLTSSTRSRAGGTSILVLLY